MEARRADYLCDRTRFHVGVYDKSKLRNGFERDKGTADRDILTSLIEAAGELLKTGYIKCTFKQRVTIDVNEYRLDAGIGSIIDVAYKGIPLDQTTIPRLNRDRKRWRVSISGADFRGTPREWYNTVSDVIGLVPAPGATDDPDGEPSLAILAEATTEELSTEGSTLQRLPIQFHDFVPIGAALRILSSMPVEIVPDKEARIEFLTPKWQEAIEAVQKDAQHKSLSEVGRIVPLSYKRRRPSRWGRW